MTSNPNPRKRPAPGSANEFVGANLNNAGLMYQPLPNYTVPPQQMNTGMYVSNDMPGNQLVRSQPQFLPNNTNSPMIQMAGVPRTEEENVVNDSARRVAKAKNAKKTIPPFVQKLAKFVNDPQCDDVIRWSDDGGSFLVLDEDAFSKNLIPDLFKHNNYASFVRQLNMYGFHKVVGLSDGSMKTAEQRSKPILEYTNENFRKDLPDLLWLIQKPKGSGKKKTGKKVKNERDSEEDGASSDDGAVDEKAPYTVHQPRMIEDGSHVHPDDSARINATPALDLSQIMIQLEAIKHHQGVISNALSRLRSDHNGLARQAMSFEQKHSRHETSINSILSFLATVYDKNLGGQLNGSAYNNMVANGQQTSNNAVVSSPSPSPNVRLFKKAPLLLENGPAFKVLDDEASQFDQAQLNNVSGSNGGNFFNTINTQPMNAQTPYSNQSYQSPSIQEIFTPSNGLEESSPEFEHAQLQPVSNSLGQQAQRSNAATPRLSPGMLSPAIPRTAVDNHLKQLDHSNLSLSQLEKIQHAQDNNINSLNEILKEVMASSKQASPSGINGPTLTLDQPTPNGSLMNSNYVDFGNTNDYGNGGDLTDYFNNDFLNGNTSLDFTNDPNSLNAYDGTGFNGDLGPMDFNPFAENGRIVSTNASSEAESPHSTSHGLGEDAEADLGGSAKKRRLA